MATPTLTTPATPASHYVPISPDNFDKANDAVTRASALLNVVSNSYDSELGAFTPRDQDVWLSVLTALRLVDEASEALAVTTLVDVVQQELATRASGPA